MTRAAAQRLAYLLIFVTPALWGVNYLVARSAVDVTAPHALALGRWVLAGLLLTAFSWHELKAKRAAIRAEWRSLIVLGALGMWICGAFVYIGAHTTAASNIALIYAVSPVLIALYSTLALGERMGPAQAVGVALAFVGVLHVALKGHWPGLLTLSFTRGDIWIAVAAFAWTAYALILKGVPSSFGPLARLALTCWGGVVVLLPFTLIEAVWYLPTLLDARTLLYVVAVALFPGFGAYLAFSFMQRELGAARVGVVIYLGPLYSAALAWAVLGEPVHPYHLVGAVLILPGIFLATRAR
ncbi:MAG: DMT family transporter [Burkholderiales bacterium]|nr:DMT family transporter [Burkholderiales bacterium]